MTSCPIISQYPEFCSMVTSLQLLRKYKIQRSMMLNTIR